MTLRKSLAIVGMATVVVQLLVYFYLQKPSSSTVRKNYSRNELEVAAFFSSLSSDLSLIVEEELADDNDDRKLIYFGTKFFGSVFKFSELPPECRTTRNPRYLKKADAVIVHILEGQSIWTEKTRQRLKVPYNQVWVGLLYESPLIYPVINGFFNYTMTYRTDSDVFSPYSGRFERVKKGKAIADLEPGLEMLRLNGSRNKKVIWMVSNCAKLNNRLAYALELSKHISVDIYGHCSPQGLSCPRGNDRECWEMAAANYKFYLSFESSHCKDYVTEKLFTPAYFGLLPIVYGASSSDDYKRIAPENSYIDTRNFESPKKLADFLYHLDNSSEKYNSYFHWRSHYMVHYNRSFLGQDILCSKLWNLDKNRKTSYTPIELNAWWNGNKTCVSPPYEPSVPSSEGNRKATVLIIPITIILWFVLMLTRP